MNLAERNAVAEVSRIVEKYNSTLSSAPGYDGTGHISLTGLPDDPDDLIDSVILAMQKKKSNLEQAGHPSVVREVSACVRQVRDAKSLLD